MKRFIFKKDAFKENRGNYSRLLEVSCSHCHTYIATYQKDGSGPLKRLYLDRIVEPKNLVDLEKMPLAEIENLVCKKCGRLIAIPSVYEEEKRKVFLLLSYAFTKKIIQNI